MINRTICARTQFPDFLKIFISNSLHVNNRIPNIENEGVLIAHINGFFVFPL